MTGRRSNQLNYAPRRSPLGRTLGIIAKDPSAREPVELPLFGPLSSRARARAGNNRGPGLDLQVVPREVLTLTVLIMGQVYHMM